MKHVLLLILTLLPAMAFAAAPVQVTLQAAASVTANADGFFTLAQVATLNGGTATQQKTLASVVVGRVPLPGETRTLKVGDVCLKLRQAGLRPGTDAVLEGAGQLTVMALSAPPEAALAPSNGGAGVEIPRREAATRSSETLVHTGDSVAIVVQDGPISITARGAAREPGAAGQSIRVHREGQMSDLHATVVDAQTVRLEM